MNEEQPSAAIATAASQRPPLVYISTNATLTRRPHASDALLPATALSRRVRTASGATAVQIAQYLGGRHRLVVKIVGSAHTEAELGMLLERVRDLLAEPAQEMLQLGDEPSPRVATLTTAPVEQGVLDPTPVAASHRRDGLGRVVSTDSRLLFDTLAAVFTTLSFDDIGDEVFRDLVIARIVEPTSLLDVGRVLTDLGHSPSSYATMKRTQGRAKTGRYRDQIATACFAHAASRGDISLILYDVTTDRG